MSNFRNAVPLLLVALLGIGNGIYVFDPAFKEQAQEKYKDQHQPVSSKPDNETTEAPAETIAKDSKPSPLEVANKSDSTSTPSAEGASSWGSLLQTLSWSRAKKPELEASPISDQQQTSDNQSK
ncbi:uncharacterized protein K452DRAFT_318943 [Aplosporella prunicola CBS 121167]|uniref:Uncharacterized protein n=1 Tax=Aplosporella prunicola CBS 121167 TaxID=1176127 RepID=A0A6A6BAR3_9PEZI|nr:uncharacterized protein K452DRAFT_318943 [Aplosporella prunicola CBS 121167]KAF2141299.1 hypothetical protein K452DRAFT_318943 [Aplosporella prunicola CBS 121167]